MRRDQVVKLKDIADAAGVAVATVSAALNGTGTVSQAMRERVRKVAAEMNYEPNIAAKLQIHSAAGLTIYAIVNKLVELSEIKETLPES